MRDEREDGAEVENDESVNDRQRAEAAEQRLEQIEQELEATRQSLNEREAALRDAERRQRIDQLLSESEAVDLEAARLLTEVAVAQMDEPDVAAAVADLRSRKPYLFRRRDQGPAAAGTGAMAARRRGGAAVELSDAAEEAATTGQRRDLLRYLRMRRKNKR